MVYVDLGTAHRLLRDGIHHSKAYLSEHHRQVISGAVDTGGELGAVETGAVRPGG